MATQTTNLHLAKPDYSDAADIAVINGNMDTIDAVSGSVIQTIVGSTNTTGHTINSGEYFVANGSKYKATASIPNGSAWAGSASAVSENDIINSLNSNVTAALASKTGNVYINAEGHGSYNSVESVAYVFSQLPSSIHAIATIQFAQNSYGVAMVNRLNANYGVYLMIMDDPLNPLLCSKQQQNYQVKAISMT